jgi:hypothetical protein
MITESLITVGRLLEETSVTMLTKIPAHLVYTERTFADPNHRYEASDEARVRWSAHFDYSEARIIEIYANVLEVIVPMQVMDVDENPIEQSVIKYPPERAVVTSDDPEIQFQQIAAHRNWKVVLTPKPSGTTDALPYYPRELHIFFNKHEIQVAF